MYIERLSTKNIERILQRLYKCSSVQVIRISLEYLSNRTEISKIDIEFKCLDYNHEKGKDKSGKIIFTDYMAFLEKFDSKEVNSFDISLIGNYQQAVLKELKLEQKVKRFNKLVAKYEEDINAPKEDNYDYSL